MNLRLAAFLPVLARGSPSSGACAFRGRSLSPRRTPPIPTPRPHQSRPTPALSSPARVPPFANLASLTAAIDPTVFRSALSAISKLLVTLFFGVLAAKRGLLDGPTLSALSKTVYNIFLPCLLFTNVVRTLARGAATQLFLLPVVAFVQVLLGLFLGVAGGALLRLNDSERRIFLVCTAFGNSAALPLLFANALFDASAAHLSAMISSISFFLIGWTGLFWSIGYSTLAGLPDPRARGAEAVLDGEGPGWRNALAATAKRALSPPLVAAMSGLTIGLVGPVRDVFVASPAFTALQTLGTGYSPAAVLILAGSLARKVEKRDEAEYVNPQSVLRVGRLTAGIAFCRFVLMPVFGILVVRKGAGVFKSPFVKLAILLEAIMPSAQNSTLILNLEGKPDAAAKLARILLAVYVTGILPVSIGLTYFLGFAGV